MGAEAIRKLESGRTIKLVLCSSISHGVTVSAGVGTQFDAVLFKPLVQAALLEALDLGHLGGCALDVGRAPDQMPSPALARHPLVIATQVDGVLLVVQAGKTSKAVVRRRGTCCAPTTRRF